MSLKTIIFWAFWSGPTPFVMTFFGFVATFISAQLLVSSPTHRGHNFFILTRIWACEVSLERYLNVECNHG